ncbi:hypothetical protein [Ramlibacter sp. WS9]|uniref:hypothetical protein n=1 Tax=Ramlibacter sp. WS9 TaxID=1882741 RepID=UPI0011444369|nr:hypothetical protein [Ramlibacter sp. WS9]
MYRLPLTLLMSFIVAACAGRRVLRPDRRAMKVGRFSLLCQAAISCGTLRSRGNIAAAKSG